MYSIKYNISKSFFSGDTGLKHIFDTGDASWYSAKNQYVTHSKQGDFFCWEVGMFFSLRITKGLTFNEHSKKVYEYLKNFLP